MLRRPPRSTPLYSSAASDVYKRQGVNLDWWVEDPEDDRGSGGLGWTVGGFLGGEAPAWPFLGAGVGPGRALRHEVAAVGDLCGEVVLEVVEVSGGKRPRRH